MSTESPDIQRMLQERWQGYRELTPQLSLLLLLTLMLLMNPRRVTITELEVLNRSYKRPRIDSYVPPWLMYILVGVCPIVIFFLPYENTQHDDSRKAFLGWSLAMMVTGVITEAIKLYFRRPRPDFFYRCFPDGIVKGTRCTGSVREVVEGRKSFPSGHSSFAFCSFGFISLWLVHVLGGFRKVKKCYFAIFVCITPLLVALGISISRCFDNHHHWQDVLVGSTLGFLSACSCFYYYFNCGIISPN